MATQKGTLLGLLSAALLLACSSRAETDGGEGSRNKIDNNDPASRLLLPVVGANDTSASSNTTHFFSHELSEALTFDCMDELSSLLTCMDFMCNNQSCSLEREANNMQRQGDDVSETLAITCEEFQDDFCKIIGRFELCCAPCLWPEKLYYDCVVNCTHTAFGCKPSCVGSVWNGADSSFAGISSDNSYANTESNLSTSPAANDEDAEAPSSAPTKDDLIITWQPPHENNNSAPALKSYPSSSGTVRHAVGLFSSLAAISYAYELVFS